MQRVLHLFACIVIAVNCLAQQVPYVHYTPKDGLINSRVRKAYQDSRGRMYFLTFGGLSVYDGARFKNYTRQNGLANDLLNDILEVGPDSLLIATNAAELNALVRGKIVTIRIQGDSCPLINQFYRHDDGRIFLSSDHGLFELVKNTVHQLDISGMTMSSGFPYLGAISGSGNHLLLTTNEMIPPHGIYIYDIINNRISDILPHDSPYFAGKYTKKQLWIGVRNKLFILDPIALSNGLFALKDPPKQFETPANYSLIGVAFEHGCSWLIYGDQRLSNKEIRYIDGSGTYFSIPIPVQASTTGIRASLIDREKTIWLSIDGEGVFKLLNSPLEIFQNPITADTRIDRAYFSKNETWFNSNWSSPLSKVFRTTSNGIKEYRINLEKTPVIFYADDHKIFARDFSYIYTGIIDEKNKRIDFRNFISCPKTEFFGNQTMVDPNGNILLHQKSALRIWNKGQYIDSVMLYGPDYIEGLGFDKQKHLWLVKRHSGIEVFKISDGSATTYLRSLYKFSREELIGSPRSFVIDKNDQLWIGTREHGLFAFRVQQENNQIKLQRIYHFETGNGLTDNFVTSLACDSSNNIIVGTQTGLDRILFSSGKFRIENLSKGSNFFAYISQTWSEGKRSFALTNSGVLLEISATQSLPDPKTPQLFLEEMKVNAQPVEAGRKVFRHKENTISFLVAAPSFIDEKQITYSYLLEGSGNRQWSDTSAANAVINLTNLSSSSYQLKVKAFFPSNSYPPAEFAYAFEIRPPWWQTWWFRGLVIAVCMGLLIAGIRFYYRRKLERERVILEKQQVIEKERTRIATDMHDDLGAGLSRIKFLSETIGIKKQQQQPFEEDISKIREYSHEMIDKMGEIVWALNEKHDTLSDLLSYTRSYAVSYLAQNGIQCEIKSPGPLSYRFISGEFRRNIFLTVKEALHNIVKHAKAGKVAVRIQADQQLSIEIADDGTGFNKNEIRPFSNGLANMEKRIRELGGIIEILNEKGTTVRFSVPM